MRALPRPGQKVCWRYPRDARRCGWEAVFGPGPFEVVGLVDSGDGVLAATIVLRTRAGERPISEVWLVPADDPENGAGGQGAVSGAQPERTRPGREGG
jgi:hypothetical protein